MALRARPSLAAAGPAHAGRRFEISRPAGWEPFYIKGVNLGVALPGQVPVRVSARFGDIRRVAGHPGSRCMPTPSGCTLSCLPCFTGRFGAGTRRIRTRALWLIHGVWTELPPHHDFENAVWKGDFRSEMRQGGGCSPRSGHDSPASGARRRAVRRGRFSVDAGIHHRSRVGAFRGQGVRRETARRRKLSRQVIWGSARVLPWISGWLRSATTCSAYEADTYNALRPIAYTNWPTLDPLRHPTEATTDEEAQWRRRSGRRSEAKRLEYENDAIGLDPNLVRPTTANPAGWFAAYHAYPYYPDFMMLDPGYRAARSARGRVELLRISA